MIIKDVMLHSAEDLRQFMYLAMQSSEDIGVHTTDGKIADAKSILGLMALDSMSYPKSDWHFEIR